MTDDARASKAYRTRKARGEPATMPVALVRTRIQELYDLGLKPQMIASAANMSVAGVLHIMRHNTHYVRIELAARIFKVTHHPDPRQTHVPAVGARRRIRALNAIGWSTHELATRLNITTNDGLNDTIGRPTVTYVRWAAIRDLYEQLSGTPGGNAEALRVARRLKYAPPLAWEGIDIDHARAQPDWAAAGIKLAERSECARGHAYTPKNTKREPNGHRICLTCQRANYARAQAARRARAAT
ncbi:hypothetical protein [Nocardia sp. NPDC060249]|uniref:hypothetical protein n=1 Tax=Nocardia sp. NPDC060249 TaxID=3347082 RepID=UPI003657235B